MSINDAKTKEKAYEIPLVEDKPEYKKPPLGAPPYWIAMDARIREVGGAISRYDSTTQSIKNVKAWAEELLAYCSAIERIQNKYKVIFLSKEKK